MKDKQIEEMTKVIARRSKAFRNPNIAFMTTAEKTAESLYNADYRKASDVAREAIDELERRLYSVSYRETSITGYSYSVVDIDEIAYEAEELKKKYESEGEG